jgi:hypothetical protein
MSASTGTRVAIIGDVGGQRRCLDACLRALGVDPSSHRLPPDLTIVQVGDLIGAKQDDQGIVEEVDQWLTLNPSRWIQLAGNWEQAFLDGRYLRRSRSVGPELEPDASAVEQLSTWMDARALRVAVAVRSSRGMDALVTHAGMTRTFWQEHCGSDSTASGVAVRMNELGIGGGSPVGREGEMCGASDGNPGPLWASGREVWQSWLGEELPFNQVHGHSSPYFWGKRVWNDDISQELKGQVTLKPELRHLWFEQGGTRIVGIDPGLWDRSKPVDLHPLVLHDAVVLA